MTEQRRVSMAAVAARAGVSHQTVSRVVNTPHQVRESTRHRVEQAIRELGFRPNLAARALVTGDSARLIGAISPGEALFGPSNMLAAIDRAAHAHDYATIVGTLTEADVDAARVTAQRFLALGADGVVFIATGPTTAGWALTLADRLPVCVIASGFGDDKVSTVGVDQGRGVRAAVHHLVAKGRSRIAHVAGPDDWFDARERSRSWHDTCSELGVLGPRLAGGWVAADGHRAAQTIADDPHRPDAVICANDHVALGLMHGLAERGVSVPEDVAVVGFDDVDGSDHFTPPLTTLRQPFARVGGRSIEVLEAMIRGAGPVQEWVAPELVVRASSG